MTYVGCAGWALPREARSAFGEGASNLERYATRLNATEINSSFYRPHQQATYERWAASVPDGFRFTVKLPKAISHERRLAGCESLLQDFLAQVQGLGGKLGCLLLQLPPSLSLDTAAAQAFFAALRRQHTGQVAVEPRHASWFTADADELLRSHGLARVLADPVLHDEGRQPGGARDPVYLRLHGSPRPYWSAYGDGLIAALARRICQEDATLWCIFDNTASGAATHNALALLAALTKDPG